MAFKIVAWTFNAIVIVLAFRVGFAVYGSAVEAGWWTIACLALGFITTCTTANLIVILTFLNISLLAWSVLQLAGMFDPAARESVYNWMLNTLESWLGDANAGP